MHTPAVTIKSCSFDSGLQVFLVSVGNLTVPKCSETCVHLKVEKGNDLSCHVHKFELTLATQKERSFELSIIAKVEMKKEMKM